MRVLSMTPEQINMLPAQERATYIQIVSHFPINSSGVELIVFLAAETYFRCTHWIDRPKIHIP